MPLFALVYLAVAATALPTQQQHLSRPMALVRPAISPAPYGDMIGVAFRVLDAGAHGVGRWRVMEAFLPVGVRLRVGEWRSIYQLVLR